MPLSGKRGNGLEPGLHFTLVTLVTLVPAQYCPVVIVIIVAAPFASRAWYLRTLGNVMLVVACGSWKGGKAAPGTWLLSLPFPQL